MKETFDFLNKLLKKDDSIVVCVSGGPDSMCLLYVLNKFKKKLNLKIICAHVNHGLRKESEKEAEFVKDYCTKNGIIFEYYKIEEYKNNKFSEDEGRKKRYTFFKQMVGKYQAKYLMTAHHGNDLEETILMRIVRGSNLKGYAGFPKISDNGNYSIVRPLINLTKKEILTYLKGEKVKYVIDKTNDSDKYTRNRYRKHVLPFLEKEEKNVHLKFYKFSEELNRYNNYIKKIILSKIDNIYKNNIIDIEKLQKEDEFIQEKIIEYVIELIQKKDILDINEKQFKEIINLAINNKNKKISLNNGYIARRSYNSLIIEKEIQNNTEYNYIFNKELNILNKYKFEIIKESNDKSNFVIRLQSDEINMPLIIRNFKNGDKIRVKNLNGTKKVKDIFIEAKVDVLKRREYPIVTDSKNTIIWVPGLKKSTFDKEISEKCDIILKCTEEKNE